MNKFNLVQHTYLTRRNSFVNSYHIPIQCMGHGLLQKRKIFQEVERQKEMLGRMTSWKQNSTWRIKFIV